MGSCCSALKDEYYLARKAYAAYGEATGFRNFQGDDMPAFDDLSRVAKDAWMSAAMRVVEEVK